jgi:hypothetical protein
MGKSWIRALAACVGLLSSTSLAEATLLSPGQTAAPLMQEGTLGPANFDMVPFTPYAFVSLTGPVTGTYREFVSTGRTGNPLGGLSFEYQFTVDATSTGFVFDFTADGFAGWQTNVTFAPGGTTVPSAAARSADGDVIDFTLAAPPGQTTMWLIVDTDAPADILNNVALAGSGGSTTPQPALGPAAAVVPEPGTLTLSLVGLALTGAFGWKAARRRAKAIRP